MALIYARTIPADITAGTETVLRPPAFRPDLLFQQFYTEKLKTVTPNSVIHYHAVIYQALKYAMKTDMVPQNVAMKGGRPRKNSFQPTFFDAEQMQKLFGKSEQLPQTGKPMP